MSVNSVPPSNKPSSSLPDSRHNSQAIPNNPGVTVRNDNSQRDPYQDCDQEFDINAERSLPVTYEKVCDRAGYCLVRVKPIQIGITMVGDSPVNKSSLSEDSPTDKPSPKMAPKQESAVSTGSGASTDPRPAPSKKKGRGRRRGIQTPRSASEPRDDADRIKRIQDLLAALKEQS